MGALRLALFADVESLASALLGEPNKRASKRKRSRWGSKGSLAVEVRGAKKGLWFNHEDHSGGDVFELIRHVNKCSFNEAVAWARRVADQAIKLSKNGLVHLVQRREAIGDYSYIIFARSRPKSQARTGVLEQVLERVGLSKIKKPVRRLA